MPQIARSKVFAYLHVERLATSSYENNNAPYYAKFDAEQHLTHLFIMSPSAREITACFRLSRVFLVDATYKTNRLRLPLLHIVGVTAANNSYTFAYCFMRNEPEGDYIRAMQNTRQVFGMFDIATPKIRC